MFILSWGLSEGPGTCRFGPVLLGCFMMKRLGDDDAMAVDLLLDYGNKPDDGNSGYVLPVGDAVAKRIGAVETVLRLLAEMPAPDPSPDLVQRTLRRINSSSGATLPEAGQHLPALTEGQQHA